MIDRNIQSVFKFPTAGLLRKMIAAFPRCSPADLHVLFQRHTAFVVLCYFFQADDKLLNVFKIPSIIIAEVPVFRLNLFL